MSGMLFYLQGSVERLLEERHIGYLTGVFTAFIFVITCQDIAVDSWAVDMLDPRNSSYASTCQSVGQKLGVFISTSLFIALHSSEFCLKYLGSEREWLSLGQFMYWWSIVQVAVTLYIAFLVPEKGATSLREGGSAGEEEKNGPGGEGQYTLRQVFVILKDIIKNRNLQAYFAFRCILVSTMMINGTLGQVYLTNDVSYSSSLYYDSCES
jgi:hypothetical protein